MATEELFLEWFYTARQDYGSYPKYPEVLNFVVATALILPKKAVARGSNDEGIVATFNATIAASAPETEPESAHHH